MTLKPGQFFTLMETAYRHGVLDKSMALYGSALDKVRDKWGIGTEDLLEKLNGAEEKSIALVDRLLFLSGPLLRIASNDLLMRILSRLLDFHIVQIIIRWLIQVSLEIALLENDNISWPIVQRIRDARARLKERSA